MTNTVFLTFQVTFFLIPLNKVFHCDKTSPPARRRGPPPGPTGTPARSGRRVAPGRLGAWAALAAAAELTSKISIQSQSRLIDITVCCSSAMLARTACKYVRQNIL
jgi:hypothetical protein